MSLISNGFKLLISLPKIIYVNFKVFSIEKAIRFPILCSYNLKIGNLTKNSIRISDTLSPFMIKINWESGSEGINIGESSKGFLHVADGSSITFKGRASMASGISIRIDNGEVIIGKNFFCNKNCNISCMSSIMIGDNSLLGWNVVIRDSDGHPISDINNSEVQINLPTGVFIGEHVWIASHVTLLKGSLISSNSVVGYNSCITRQFLQKNCIIAGYPAKIIRENISWEI
ncbi:TPA: acyltransferase [Streptococcus suis]